MLRQCIQGPVSVRLRSPLSILTIRLHCIPEPWPNSQALSISELCPYLFHNILGELSNKTDLRMMSIQWHSIPKISPASTYFLTYTSSGSLSLRYQQYIISPSNVILVDEKKSFHIINISDINKNHLGSPCMKKKINFSWRSVIWGWKFPCWTQILPMCIGRNLALTWNTTNPVWCQQRLPGVKTKPTIVFTLRIFNRERCFWEWTDKLAPSIWLNFLLNCQ